ASVTRPENGSPLLLEKVASVFSSFTFRAVPAGKDMLVCAVATVASNVTQRSIVSFLISPPNFVRECCIQKISTRNRYFLHCRHHMFYRRAVHLIVATIDVAHASISGDNQRRRMRNVDRIRT